MDFAVLADHTVKIKENEKRSKYLDIARELKSQKLWNMKMMGILIIIGAFGTVLKGLVSVWKSWKSEDV